MFEITLKMISSVPQENDIDDEILDVLSSIGYIPEIKNSDEKDDVKKGVPFKLFRECFMNYPERYWTPDELIAYLQTTRPTLYRHLNKLKSLDLLEEKSDGRTKYYRLRNGSFLSAWNFVEANVKIALSNYRKRIEYIESRKGGI